MMGAPAPSGAGPPTPTTGRSELSSSESSLISITGSSGGGSLTRTRSAVERVDTEELEVEGPVSPEATDCAGAERVEAFAFDAGAADEDDDSVAATPSNEGCG